MKCNLQLFISRDHINLDEFDKIVQIYEFERSHVWVPRDMSLDDEELQFLWRLIVIIV